MEFQRENLREALAALGAVLKSRDESAEIVVIGGGALLLVGG